MRAGMVQIGASQVDSPCPGAYPSEALLPTFPILVSTDK
jgi:hypothetical protein